MRSYLPAVEPGILDDNIVTQDWVHALCHVINIYHAMFMFQMFYLLVYKAILSMCYQMQNVSIPVFSIAENKLSIAENKLSIAERSYPVQKKSYPIHILQ